MLMTSSLTAPLFGESNEEFPNSFFITERVMALVTTFDIESETKKFGSITKRFFSLTNDFDYQGPKGESIAKATEEFFSFGTVAHVFDPQGRKMGWIEEVLFTWLSPAKYRIFDQTNRLVAIARMNFWGTKFEVTDPSSQKQIAVIHRPWLRFFRDSWTVEVLDPKAMDPRLMIFVATYQTDAENRARARREMENRRRDFDEEREEAENVGILGMFSSSHKDKEQSLLQEFHSFDAFADEKIIEEWPQHEKEYEKILSSFPSAVLSHLFSKSRKGEKESGYPITQEEFEKRYMTLQKELFLESLKEGIKILKDPNLGEEPKKILYNLLNEMSKERL